VKDTLTVYNVTYHKLWLYIAYGSAIWYEDPAQNIQYVVSATTSAMAHGLSFGGYYSSLFDWISIFGDYWDPSLSHHSVWYESDDGVMDFNDWDAKHFGEWINPAKKTYKWAPACGKYYPFTWEP
jgi:hypothetical protein